MTAGVRPAGNWCRLSLVNAFAQFHGGELVISDRLNGGTRVTVTLADAVADGPKLWPAPPSSEAFDI